MTILIHENSVNQTWALAEVTPAKVVALLKR
jgi:hypothetical protein